jgi:hypothetical protein
MIDDSRGKSRPLPTDSDRRLYELEVRVRVLEEYVSFTALRAQSAMQELSSLNSSGASGERRELTALKRDEQRLPRTPSFVNELRQNWLQVAIAALASIAAVLLMIYVVVRGT